MTDSSSIALNADLAGELAGAPSQRKMRTRDDWPPRLRRAEVPGYVHDEHGLIIASATLAKLAVVGGGPEYELWGRIPYYLPASVDQWVQARLSLRRSTSDCGSDASPRHQSSVQNSYGFEATTPGPSRVRRNTRRHSPLAVPPTAERPG
jgi:hypothetical protein